MEFLFLKAGEASCLRYRERMMGLYLTVNLWGEPRDEAAEEERRRQAHNTIG